MRLLEGHQVGGLSMKQAPVLTKLDNKKAVDVVSSLRLQEIGIDLMCRNENEWKFLLIIADSVNTNRSVGRFVVCETWKYPRLLA